MNKEIRRRIKVIDSQPIEESALKIIYLRVVKLNEKLSHRVLNRKYKDELTEMFSKRYPLDYTEFVTLSPVTLKNVELRFNST